MLFAFKLLLPSSKSPLFASVGCSVKNTVTTFAADPEPKPSGAMNTNCEPESLVNAGKILAAVIVEFPEPDI